jgi:8-oxo-dGTP pyrophosphatase MutT (NUDIX family)
MDFTASDPDNPEPVLPAATVAVLRDGGAETPGLEVLMLRRNSRGFFGGMWVFPGGRVEPGDEDPSAPGDELANARRAAVRETAEEAGLALDPDGLVPYSHWTPPAEAARRYATWFFLTAVTAGSVQVDGDEIYEHAWLSPAAALARHDAGEIELAPPTWVTLWNLTRAGSAPAAVDEARRATPEHFQTHIAFDGPALVAIWHGDAGYDDHDLERPGARHRLWMVPGDYRYERTLDPAG